MSVGASVMSPLNIHTLTNTPSFPLTYPPYSWTLAVTTLLSLTTPSLSLHTLLSLDTPFICSDNTLDYARLIHPLCTLITGLTRHTAVGYDTPANYSYTLSLSIPFISGIPQYSHSETTHPPSLNLKTLKVYKLICKVTLLYWKSLRLNTHYPAHTLTVLFNCANHNPLKHTH